MKGKPSVPESEAVKRCAEDVWMSIGMHWPEIRQELERIGFPPRALDQAWAPFELTQAALGIHLQDIERLLPPPQAARVRGLLLDHFRSQMGESTAATIEAHAAAWKEVLGFHQVPTFGPAWLFAHRMGCADPGNLHASIASNPLLAGISVLLSKYGELDWWPRFLASSRLTQGKPRKIEIRPEIEAALRV